MKISELIEKLQELQNVHGDMDVMIRDNEWMEDVNINTVKIRLHEVGMHTVLANREED